MKRRSFITGTVGVLTLARHPMSRAADAAVKAPFRLLYGSDTTHILTCTSPWHEAGQKLSAEMFLASVDESVAAGADAHLLQPDLGWVPWWPSKVMPLDEHLAWFQKQFRPDAKLNPFLQFVADGGDFVKLTLDRSREKGIAGFVSFRLNDAHHKKDADDPKTTRIEAVPRFYAEHPEYRLGKQPGQTSYAAMLHDWAHEEVREFKFRLIEELCVNYDLDGLELDFMRHPYFFKDKETTTEQRREIMTSFVARVRRTLDATAREGRARWLCVRIPAHEAAHDAMGLDVQALAAAGVQMFNLSTYYHLEQQTSLPALREKVPQAAVYAELTPHTAFNGKPDARSHRRATPEQLTTAAHLAYTGGADGISLYNWQYYRQQAHEPDPPAAEPPWEVMRQLRDPETVAKLPQHYLLAVGFPEPQLPERPLPFGMSSASTHELKLRLAPPTDGWHGEGTLRVQGDSSLTGSVWSARCNGHDLKPTTDVSEPYPNPFTQLLAAPDALRAWALPASLLREEENEFEFTFTEGTAVDVIAVDVAMER